MRYAVVFENRQCVKMLIDAGVEVDMGGDQISAINTAAASGSVECMKELLAAHDNKQDWKTTPQNSGAVNDADFLKESIMAGTDESVSIVMEPLIIAARTGRVDMVEELLKSGTDVNATDEYGNTALMTAIKFSNKPILEQLVDWGANINAENNKGETALYLAVTKSHVEYDRIQSEDDQNRRKHFLNEDLLEGSSLIVTKLLREEANLHDTKSGLNPCTVHLTSAEFGNPNPTVLKMLDAGGFKKNIKKLSSVNHLLDCVQNAITEHLTQAHAERNLYFTVPQLGLPQLLRYRLLFHAVQKHYLVPNT